MLHLCKNVYGTTYCESQAYTHICEFSYFIKIACVFTVFWQTRISVQGFSMMRLKLCSSLRCFLRASVCVKMTHVHSATMFMIFYCESRAHTHPCEFNLGVVNVKSLDICSYLYSKSNCFHEQTCPLGEH